MGIFKAFKGSVSGSAADSWREYFYCPALSGDVLGVRGRKYISGRSTDTKSNPCVISEGSVAAVNEGQCALFTDRGEVKAVYEDPGEHIISGGTPGVMGGSGLKSIMGDLKNRFAFGGDIPADQRIYFINTKEITGNAFKLSAPVPVMIKDENTGLFIEAGLIASGVYSYKISDCVKFYKNVCGNFSGEYHALKISRQMHDELISALHEGIYKICREGIRPHELPLHTDKLCSFINKEAGDKFFSLRGIEIISAAFDSISLTDKDGKTVKELQKTAVYKDPLSAGAALVSAQAEAVKTAAGNSPGKACPGFIVNEWVCSCGTKNSGNFCTECGRHR